MDRLQNAWGGSHPLLYMTPPPDALHFSSNDYRNLLDESALRQHQAQVLLNNKRELLMSSAFLHRDSPQHAFERRLAHFISCSSEFKEYFACESRPAIFSSGLLAHEIAWFDAALPFISTAHGRRVRLHQMARYVRRELTRLGYALSEGTEQIIALESGTERNTLRLRDALRRRGVFGAVFCAPATPNRHSLVRLTLNAGHTDPDIERLLRACADMRGEVNP
ncbi:aminotransferase class I/II-fold pyridoxal phosphate-dependent enzyme [Cupriavidus basilensis]|uniref:aminotransferase class I/II-fold pyridoxal phosphate-dependent enzyme n=1 Tax=Cupriavidus basilensis TaxID=68895 RepID=UPI0020A63105|nr:aminotransferase class I/II-fold pyridoxal phosphate-dependent enzyme [Cupriavidus basilensis]